MASAPAPALNSLRSHNDSRTRVQLRSQHRNQSRSHSCPDKCHHLHLCPIGSTYHTHRIPFPPPPPAGPSITEPMPPPMPSHLPVPGRRPRVLPCQRARAREKESVRIKILGNKKCSATATIPTIARASKPAPASAPANATHPLPHPLLLPENQRSIPPPFHVKTHLACVHQAHNRVLGESSINRSNQK
jgi:hypothetical protein